MDSPTIFVLRTIDTWHKAYRFFQAIRKSLASDAASDRPWRVTFERGKIKRSLAQNRLQHMWYNQVSRDVYESHGQYYSPKVWKLMCKEFGLGYEVIQTPKGPRTELRHTSDLSVSEMSQYLNDIDHYLGAEWGVQLEHPQDLYPEAMGGNNGR